MGKYCSQLCLHLVIIICLCGNSVNQNISLADNSTQDATSTLSSDPSTPSTIKSSPLVPDSTTELSTEPPATTNRLSTKVSSTQKFFHSKGTTADSTITEVRESETTPNHMTTGSTGKRSRTTSQGTTLEPTTDSSDTTKNDNVKLAAKDSGNPPQSLGASSSSDTTEDDPSTIGSSSTTSSQATSAPSEVTTHTFEGLTDAKGINVIKIHGQKKRLSLADIANKQTSTATTTTTTTQPTTSKPRKMKSRKKKKRRPSKKQKSPRTPTVKSKKVRPTPDDSKPNKKPDGFLDLTTAYPRSEDTTFQIHTVEAQQHPIAYAAAAADKGEKKGGKKKKKAQGRKGDPGPKGPPGPKGAKGEPGDAASSSMPMQAASSAVLTEHFGPDKDVIVPFDLKLIDLADNYDNTTGVFICTIPGVYVVSLYLMSHPGAKVNARVFINSRPIAALWADDSKNSGFYPSSSIQTVSRLAFGDQVYVMLVDGGYGESWVHANYNAFSLFLLYEEVFFK